MNTPQAISADRSKVVVLEVAYAEVNVKEACEKIRHWVDYQRKLSIDLEIVDIVLGLLNAIGFDGEFNFTPKGPGRCDQ
jgi:hypothetical protein